MKRKRLLIGSKIVNDFSDGADTVNSITAKTMRTRLASSLIDSPKFDLKKTQENGGFLARSFWQSNILWGAKSNVL